MPVQAPLPSEYDDIPRQQLLERIAARKRELGEELVILGHHYQNDDVIQFADFRGDSLALARQAARQNQARYIVFCGVHFMAESADLLSGDDQAVCLPDLQAGCPMADMALASTMALAMEYLDEACSGRVLPITYVNSSAAVKAVTGMWGGACCTSSNVANVFRWALSPHGGGAEKILAVPDQHLPANTAAAMGYGPGSWVLYDPAEVNGGLTPEQLADATFVLWKGHCHVHQVFTPGDIAAVRAADPDVKVIVHPECPRDIVALADAAGSTSQIIQAISQAPAASHWAVGTEVNLVRRLAAENPDKTVSVIADRPAICRTMARIDLRHLLWVLDGLAGDERRNPITVPAELADDARAALRRMIEIDAVDGLTEPN